MHPMSVTVDWTMLGRVLKLPTAIFGFCVLASPVLAIDPLELPYGGEVQFYGQLSPAYLIFDDGAVQTEAFVDNSNSNSRIGVWYRRGLPWGNLSFNFETALGFRGSNSVSQNFVISDWEWDRTDIRKLEAIWRTDRIGTFYLGQGSMASDGVANKDLSGTSVVSYLGIPDTAGAFFLRTASGVLSPVSVAQAFPNFDGGRRTRIRYDSPAFRGLVLSASLGEQTLSKTVNTKDSDITLRYDHDGPLFTVTAAGGYTWIDRQTLANNRTTIASVSVKHKPTGISLSVSGGNRDTAGSYRYFKLAYKVTIPRVGPASVSVDYYAANDMTIAGSRSNSYGFGMLQRFSNPRLEGYLGLRKYEFADPTPVRYLDAYSALIGLRWKF